VMIRLAALLIAYLLGAIPFGFLLVKWKHGFDVRATGSGNIGATNVLRASGRVTAVATLALDIAKGYFAVWIAERLTGESPLWMSAAALCAMLGHVYPVFLGFKGGKAVATFVGAFLRLTPAPLIAALVVFVGVVAWTRYVSMGSVISSATFPLAVWLILHPPLPVMAAAAAGAILIVVRHRSNIEKVRAGSEDQFTFGAGSA
jgi:acyl phosphate:glycerol-3-phosphate acyltransferase